MKKFKKPPVWLIIIVFIVCVAVSVGFLTNPKRGGNEAELSDAATMSYENNRGQDIELEKEREMEQELEKEREREQEEKSVDKSYEGLPTAYKIKTSERWQGMGAGLSLYYENDPTKGRFSFGYDLLSSYFPCGDYRIENGELICNTSDGMYHYVFKIGEDNTMIFVKDRSSSVKLINDDLSGEQIEDGTVFYPEPDFYGTETIEVKAVDLSLLDLSGDSGADGAQLYYADENRIIFGGYFGLFVYDRKSGSIISSLDLEYINCNYTQGDNYCEISVSKSGRTVYLQPFTASDGKSRHEIYVFDIEENTLKKSRYDGIIGIDPVLDLFKVDYDSYAKAEYEADGEQRVCILYRGGFGVIGECSFVDYPKNGKGVTQYSPLFKPEGYEGAEEFGAEDIHDIVELKICDDGVISEIRDADVLRKIENFLSNAKKTGELVIGEVPGSWPTFNNHPNNGNRFCMFTNPIYIKRSDGVSGIIWPAEDECNIYISGKGFYQMDKGSDRGLWHIITRFTKKSDN